MTLLALWLIVFSVKAAETNNIGTNDDPGRCICDLTVSSCDSFCCCDSDCPPAQISSWDQSNVDKNLCVEERFTPWGEKYCIKKSELYADNPRRGKREVRDSNQDLFCVEVDNSPESGLFYQDISASEVDENQIILRENATLDYADTITKSRNSTLESKYYVGDYMNSSLNGSTQLGGLWPIPGPDAMGICSEMNSARWFINQPALPCGRASRAQCDGPLDPARYTTWLKVPNSPNGTSINVTVRSVKRVNADGTIEDIVPIPVNGTFSSGSDYKCSDILLEAHYRVNSDAKQYIIHAIYADIVIGETTSNETIQQKFSLQFYSMPDGYKRSGNPGYLPGLPIIFKKETTDTHTTSLTLGGRMPSGECSVGQIYPSEATVAFRVETVFSCYLDKTFEWLRDNCTRQSHSNISMFSFWSLPKWVGKWGNADASNNDDFVPFEKTENVPNSAWWNDNQTCSMPHTLVFEFVTVDVGYHSNPQSKIIQARAFFRNFTEWTFYQRYNSLSQRFFSSVIVTFLRYDGEKDFYQKVGMSALPIMPDDVIYPFRSADGLWKTALIFALGLSLLA